MNYTVGANKKVYLDFSPKKGTLYVSGYSVVENATPLTGQVSITYATEAYAANILTFHKDLATGTVVDIVYSPYLFLQQNLDPSRTASRTEVKRVDSSGYIKLDAIPKEDSVVISGFIVGAYATPNAAQVGISYGADSGYIWADGVLKFNSAHIGAEISVTYTPIGTRVDAVQINKIIEFHNAYIGEVWKKADLASSNAGKIVHWNNLIGAPGNSDVTSWLLTEEQYQLLLTFNGTKPIGKIKAGDNSLLAPSTWGGDIAISNTGTITSTINNNKLEFNAVPGAMSGLSAGTLAALDGTSGIPSSGNRYVTASDSRLSDARTPTTHYQLFETIVSQIDNPIDTSKNLVAALFNKAAKVHTHTISDVTDFPASRIPTSSQISALAGSGDFYVKNSDQRLIATFPHTPLAHTHSIDDIANLSASLYGKASAYHQHNAADIIGLSSGTSSGGTGTALDSKSVRTTKLVSDFIISGLDTPNTGVQWAQVAPFKRWVAGTTYTVGDLVCPTTPNGNIYVVQNSGTSSTVEPTWPNSSASITDGTVTWARKVAVTLWQASPPVWTDSTLYATSITIRPSLQSSAIYTATTGGTSGSSMPSVWPTDSSTVQDGTVTWKYSGDCLYNVGQFVVGAWPTGVQTAYYYTCTVSGISYTSAPATWTAATIAEEPPSFVRSKSSGTGYINSNYTEVSSSINRTFCYIGAILATQTSGTSTGKKLMTGYPAVGVTRSYEVRVTQANVSAKDMSGLRTQWRQAGGTWSADINYVTTPSICDPGTVRLSYYLATAQYSVGDTWTFSISKDCDWYDYVDSSGVFTHIAVPHGASVPATPAGTTPLCKVVTNGSGISSIVDMRQINTALNFSNSAVLSYNPAFSETLTVNNIPIETRARSMTNAFIFGG